MIMPFWLAFGFFGTSGVITYSALSQSFPLHLAGRVNTALNLLVFIAAFIGQWAIGAIIEIWQPGAVGATTDFGYTTGFAMMLSLQVAAMVWFIVASKGFRRK